MFRLFEECPEENNIRKPLIWITLEKFHSLPTHYLERRQRFFVELIEELDLDDPNFDSLYDQILAGTIIYSLSYETSKYYDSKGPLYNLYPHKCKELFNLCEIKDEALYKDLIPIIGKSALEKKVIPFDETTIKNYFHYSKNNPLKAILLKRFEQKTKEVILDPSQNSFCYFL